MWWSVAAGIALIPVIFGYTRAYYVFTIIALCVTLFLVRGRVRLNMFAVVLGIVGVFSLFSLLGRSGILPRQDYWAATKARALQGVGDVSQFSGTWQSRATSDFPRIVEALKYNPLLGFGLAIRGEAVATGDSGIVTFVVAYGLLGIAALLLMTIYLYRGVAAVLKGSDDTFYRVLALGAAGGWAGMLVSQITLNWFSGGLIPVIFAGSVEFVRQRIVEEKASKIYALE